MTQNDQGDNKFDVIKWLKTIPKFDEENVNIFFTSFENLAAMHKWPADQWITLIHGALTVWALEIFSTLSPTQCTNYSTVKSAVLEGYQKVPETYHHLFRSYRKLDSQTYGEYVRLKKTLFKKWIESENAHHTADSLIELMMMEEIKNTLPRNIRDHFLFHGFRKLEEASQAADNFHLSKVNLSFRPSTPVYQSSPNARQSKGEFRYPPPPLSTGIPPGSSRPPPPNTTSITAGLGSGSSYSHGKRNFPNVCGYCKKWGHRISNCNILTKERASQGPPALLVSKATMRRDVKPSDFKTISPEITVPPPSLALYKPYQHIGSVALESRA